MTITTPEEAHCAMRQCESLERYLGRLSGTHAAMQDEYDALLNALDSYFMTEEQRRAVYDSDLSDDEALALAISLGVNPDYAAWAITCSTTNVSP